MGRIDNVVTPRKRQLLRRLPGRRFGRRPGCRFRLLRRLGGRFRRGGFRGCLRGGLRRCSFRGGLRRRGLGGSRFRGGFFCRWLPGRSRFRSRLRRLGSRFRRLGGRLGGRLGSGFRRCFRFGFSSRFGLCHHTLSILCSVCRSKSEQTQPPGDNRPFSGRVSRIMVVVEEYLSVHPPVR